MAQNGQTTASGCRRSIGQSTYGRIGHGNAGEGIALFALFYIALRVASAQQSDLRVT
jgi:hypothetical protein